MSGFVIASLRNASASIRLLFPDPLLAHQERGIVELHDLRAEAPEALDDQLANDGFLDDGHLSVRNGPIALSLSNSILSRRGDSRAGFPALSR